jgi:hypothetical protein
MRFIRIRDSGRSNATVGTLTRKALHAYPPTAFAYAESHQKKKSPASQGSFPTVRSAF